MIRRTEICTFKAHSVSLGRKEARAPLSTVRDATWPAPFSPAPLQLLPQISARVSWAPALRRRLLIRPLAYASARDRGVCAGAPRRLQGAWSSPRQLWCYNGRQRLAFSGEGRVSICSPASLAESCESLTAQKLCGRSGHDLAQHDFGSSRDGLQNGGWAVALASAAPHFCAAPMPRGRARGRAQKVPTKHIESCVRLPAVSASSHLARTCFIGHDRGRGITFSSD